MPIITAVALIAASATFAPAIPMSNSKSVRTVAPLCKHSTPQPVSKVDGPTVRKLGDEPMRTASRPCFTQKGIAPSRS